MLDDNGFRARLDAPFEFIQFPEDLEESSNLASSQQYDLGNTELGDTSVSEDFAADFADSVAQHTHSESFSNDIPFAAGDSDIDADLAEMMAQHNADLAELMARPMSTAAVKASSASAEHDNATMSATSPDDISETLSHVFNEDHDEVISDAPDQPDAEQVTEKGKGKAVEKGAGQANEKGKAPATDDDNGPRYLTDAQFEARAIMPVPRIPDTSGDDEYPSTIGDNENPSTSSDDEYPYTIGDNGYPYLTDAPFEAGRFMPVPWIPDTVGDNEVSPSTDARAEAAPVPRIPDSVRPYPHITTLYTRAHQASARARETSNFWEHKLAQNDKLFRDKRKELADRGIATLRRRNEKRDAGGIMNKKNFENVTPERKAYLLKTYGNDVKIRELTHFCDHEMYLSNEMANEMDEWKGMMEHLGAVLTKSRAETSMGTGRAREDVFKPSEIYFLDNTDQVLGACDERIQAITQSINAKPMKKDGTEFTGNIEDWTQHDGEENAEDDETVAGEEENEAEEGGKVYSTDDDEDESD